MDPYRNLNYFLKLTATHRLIKFRTYRFPVGLKEDHSVKAMELNMPATSRDVSATTAGNGSISLLDESKVPPLTSTTNDSTTQASPQLRGQSQSPISISGSDSAIVSSAVSESVETPRGNHGEVANSAQHVLPPSGDFAALSTDKVSEKVGNHVPENRKSEKKNQDQENMDVDEPELDGEQNAKQTAQADGESRDDGSSVKARNEDADFTDDDGVRLSKIQTIQETLEKMENVRLELLPLLLDIIEQVKNGELSIKDVDNACGRIRVRINRLKDSRNTVESGLQRLVDESNGTEHSQHETEERIKAKSDAISRLISAVNARKGTATS